MNLKRILRTAAIIFILALNVGCDQATKAMMRDHIRFYDQYSFFKGHVTLLNVENKGAFLSLGDSLPNPFHFILLTLLPVLALLGGLAYILIKTNISKTALLGIIFLIGGGMGNLYDRITKGSVTDFLHLKFGIFQTGIFNVADVSIMVGIGLMLLDAFIKQKNQPKVLEL
ncbi:signal peptidase II [Inquilinus sp. KBS0705]|nr:signal peptidase II [Inquilinus sp. KBS0705]